MNQNIGNEKVRDASRQHGFTLDPTTTTVNVASSNETGRLSWQELVPDND